MKRLYSVIVIGLLAMLLGSCGGGGDDGPGGLDNSPLAIQLLRATPSTGSSPLRVTFTVSISGGVAPYYYMWDYTNDGAVDQHVNQTFDRTLSVQNDYYVRASDAGGTSVYECQLKVMDSSGDPALVPDPLTVTVLSGSGITFGEQTYWFSDFSGNDGEPIARTGEPVYFRVQPLAGTAPYTYQWDFNEDGQIDSTVANPQYTYTYNGAGVDIRKASVTVLDSADEKGYYDYLVPVHGPGSTEPPNPEFEAILNSAPPAQDGVITLNWAAEGTSGLPTEPELDLSVTIDPDPSKSGVPPYEYYWDFENDGKFDSQAPSPTIPYYDYERKITVNPYLHLLDSKDYTLRVMVIDSVGSIKQFTRTVTSKNLDGSSGLLAVDANYGFGDPLQPFLLLTGGDPVNDTHGARFNITTSGSPGNVQYQFDANGDGLPENTIARPGEDPLNPDEWETPASGNFLVEWDYQGIGFFPTAITVRTIDSENNQIDVETLQVPLSIVKGSEIRLDEGLETRTDMAMTSSWDIQAAGPNNQSLASREVMISGGRRGNTALRSNISIVQTYSQPAAAGSAETLDDTTVVPRLQLNQERYNHWQWTEDPMPQAGALYHVFGGEYFLGGELTLSAQSEFSAAANPAMSVWTVGYEMGPEGFLTLTDACGDYIGATPITGKPAYNYAYVFVGGVMDRTGTVVNQVSRRFISFDPTRPAMMQPAYVLAGPDIPTGRYDAAAVYDPTRLMYYVLGGRVASGESVRTVEVYDVQNGIWLNLPPMQDLRSGHTASIIDGKIYVIGGGYYPPDEADFTLVTTAEVFNPNTGTWSYTAVPPGVANNAAAAALPGPGAVSGTGQTPNTIWYFGGENEVGVEKNSMYELVYFYTVLQPTATP